MCGIIAVLRRASGRPAPGPRTLADGLAEARARLGTGTDALDEIASGLEALDRTLSGVPGLMSMLASDGEEAKVLLADLSAIADERERSIEERAGEDVEKQNAALVRLKDALFALSHDRLGHAEAVRRLCREDATVEEVSCFSSIEIALSALDRLEVRGRDSAGLAIVVFGVDTAAQPLAELLRSRSDDRMLRDGSVRVAGGALAVVYKHAAEIGELGDNVRALRSSIARDALLRAALAQPGVEAAVLGHTRWASVGIISEANAHPLDERESGEGPAASADRGREAGGRGHFVLGALNGDVDNHEDLVSRHGLAIPPAITTDAKTIPVLVGRRLGAGLARAFEETAPELEGSVAIALISSAEKKLALALRGSGQALYVGLAEDLFVAASEPYGIVETCRRHLRLEGEASGGQIAFLDAERAGSIEGIRRASYDGAPLPVREHELRDVGITTRDVERGGAPHFLLKEIREAPDSLRKTLRGRIARENGRLRAVLPASSMPVDVASDLAAGRIARILVIGQGTAAVAGKAVARMLERALLGSPIAVKALPATELSGFGLAPDMSDSLIVAISQSGTTTDTNRAVDLVRSRGARVIAIVNRRGSDLTDKSDGVLYTSDGRDVEMSVASTKAFYAQCAAGQILALAAARAAGRADDAREHELLEALQDLPRAMREVLAQDAAIAAAAAEHAPLRRHWALVGNGPNRIAAEEIRIKLSELCYKSIACDATEDKKHIDLSSEPLILVCAAGLEGSTADDVAKEIAIYRAHKACPIAIASRGDDRFGAAVARIEVPRVHADLAFVLATMAGHLFGYRAALAIDALARPLRSARAAVERATRPDGGGDLLRRLRPLLEPHWRAFCEGLAAGRYDGALEARTSARLSILCAMALGLMPLDAGAEGLGAAGGPGAVVDALTEELTRAIDQLTRPIDAIKHQAKTVTVGTSRADEALLRGTLARTVLDAGVPRDRLGYRDLRALAALDPAVREVLGFTRYSIEGDVEREASISVVGRGGIARNLPSRTESDPVLRGQKHLVARERIAMVARGRKDGRTILMIPEVELGRTRGLLLLHLAFHDRLPAEVLRGVLAGYRNRFEALRDAVTETEREFDESRLERFPASDLLTEPIYVLADRWRREGAG
ncbi:MAG: hypothetical protein Fur0037_14970 [Planctomycetota bacterium]